MGSDFNAFSYFHTGSWQSAGSLQDSFLAAMLRRFDEGINAQQTNAYENNPECQFRSDIHMAYLNEHIQGYRLKRDDIMLEVTDAAGESSKTPRLQQALQEFDENFDLIGFVNFNWGYAINKSLPLEDRRLREWSIPQPRSTIIKIKYALRYLAGQERTRRMSGMAQRITPQLLNLRSRGQDMHRVLRVALQPWPTLAVIEYTTRYQVGDTYFKADHFSQYNHDNIQIRRAYRQDAVNEAGNDMDNQFAPVQECELSMCKKPQPRTLSQLDPDLVAGSSGSLTRSSFSTLPSEDTRITLRSKFSVARSEAEYPDTIDGDFSVKPMAHTNTDSHAVH